MKYQTSERCPSAQSERLNELHGLVSCCNADFLSWLETVNSGGHDAGAGGEAAGDRSPPSFVDKHSTLFSETVLEGGSTTQTKVAPSLVSTADAGTRMRRALVVR